MMFCVLALPLTVLANSQSFTPPAEKGTIYVIMKYRQTFGPQATQISINWGAYSNSDTINPPQKGLFPGSAVPEGFVIRLKHKKADSIRLDASSNGYIQNIYQGGEPSECSRKEWKCINW